jgi:hypothetical protein
MDEIAKHHLDRIRSATTHRHSRVDLSKWISDNTFINGRNYSYKDHEYQQRIVDDPSQELVFFKAAQLGLSEISLRMALGLVMTTHGGLSLAYVFPTAGFASQYSQTRFQPIISGSPLLRASMTTEDLDGAAVKTFGPNRTIFFKGAGVGTTSAISVSLDAIIFDELDFASQDIVGDYTSRLIHSKHKLKIKLSTPTFEGGPISTAFQSSRRWRNMCRCNHCAGVFYPEYYSMVRVPGWDKHLDEITSENIHTIGYKNAQLHCPLCGKVPSLQPAHRFWDCENPSETHVATGYKITPFDAPNVISVPYLIEASTSYSNKASFRNYSLGECASSQENGLTAEELEAAAVEMVTSPFTTHTMGVDLGNVSHFVVGGVGSDGKAVIIHYERVPLNRFRERYFALKAQYRVTVACMDIQPFTDLVMSLSMDDSNLFACQYVTRNGLELFEVKQKELDIETATGPVRQVAVNRTAIFDKLMVEVREGRLLIRRTADWLVYRAHAIDMKRAQAQLRSGEFASNWVKSAKGFDHFWHATAYFLISSQMRGLAHGMSLPPSVRTFKVKPKA